MKHDVLIRRVRPADAPALRRFYAGLSVDSRHARFLGLSGVSDQQSLSFCTPDHMHHEGFVAVSDRVADRGALLGHLCLEPADDRRLELAVAVSDAEQGHGIGRRLFRAALEWATERGFDAVIASCFASNSRVLSLLSSSRHPATISGTDSGVVYVTVPLRAPLPADWSLAAPPRSDRRRRTAATASGRPCRVMWRPMQH